MDHFDLHAVMQIYEKSLQHPNLKAIRDWAQSELQKHNDILSKAATAVIAEHDKEEHDEPEHDETEHHDGA